VKSDPQSLIEVLVVDDSAVVRHLMSTILVPEEGFHVTTASDPVVAMAQMRRLRPHVILLDLEMPRMDGITFLKQLMATDPVPVVVCSGFADPGTMVAMRALAAGAVDVLTKPRVSARGSTDANGLLDVVRAAAQAKVGAPRVSRPQTTTLPGLVAPLAPKRPPERSAARPSVTGALGMNEPIIAIGASTGGTEALRDILRAMPFDAPGIVIVQHMPAGFTAAFADHLNSQCKIEVCEASPGDRVLPGRAIVARGNRHLVVQRRGSELVVELPDDAPVCRHRPSVDVLFRSVARVVGNRAVGALLTGMGADGAEGLLEMKRAGAATIAQDEVTSVVFGMPKEAIDRGAVDVVLPLQRITAGILQRIPTSTGPRVAESNR
jgi:two-component system chemotaxis response regulator CheB